MEMRSRLSADNVESLEIVLFVPLLVVIWSYPE